MKMKVGERSRGLAKGQEWMMDVQLDGPSVERQRMILLSPLSSRRRLSGKAGCSRSSSPHRTGSPRERLRPPEVERRLQARNKEKITLSERIVFPITNKLTSTKSPRQTSTMHHHMKYLSGIQGESLDGT